MTNIMAKPNTTLTSVTPIASTHVHKGINTKKPIPISIIPIHPMVEPFSFCFSLSVFLHMEKYAIKSPAIIKGMPIFSALVISSPSANPTIS